MNRFVEAGLQVLLGVRDVILVALGNNTINTKFEDLFADQGVWAFLDQLLHHEVELDLLEGLWVDFPLSSKEAVVIAITRACTLHVGIFI